MKQALLIALALVVCAVAVRGDEESALANVETVEPTFLEADAESSPLFQLPKKLAKTTVEPRYYGEKPAPKKYVSPEYQDPTPVKLSPKERKNQPVLFTSHYFSPLPKKVNGKKLRVSRQKRGRLLVPFRATVETPAGHRRHKGFTEAELWDGRLPNKFDDPAQNMKKTKAPAPQLSLLEAQAEVQEGLEADTTDEAELEAENAPVPPPFQHDEGEQVATIVDSAEGFFDQNYQPPTWKDEDATESELLEVAAHDESEDEAEEEAEEESEDEEEADEESEDESEEEADEEADDEAEEEIVEEVSLVETAGAADEEDSVDAEMDEMAQNEAAAAQVDMDATSDEASMAEGQEITETTVEEVDSDEASSSEEADAAEEEVTEDEAVEDAEVAEAVSLVEVTADAEEVDTLLSEIDSHLSSASDSDAETEGEAEAEAEAEVAGAKGTPGSRIAAGQTWEEHQNERLNAMEQQLAAEKAAAPKVQAQVVSADQLSAVDADHQVPAYDSAEAQVETVEPELLVEQSAQAVLKSKIAQLKAINRS